MSTLLHPASPFNCSSSSFMVDTKQHANTYTIAGMLLRVYNTVSKLTTRLTNFHGHRPHGSVGNRGATSAGTSRSDGKGGRRTNIHGRAAIVMFVDVDVVNTELYNVNSELA